MKKYALAAILALPFIAIGVPKASANGCTSCGEGGGCTPTYRIGFSLGLCWRGWCKCDRYPCDPCGAKPGFGPCGSCCNPFVGGYGPMPPPGAGGAGYGALAPWYQYYPGGGAPTGGGTNFPTPAPTGFPYGGGGSQTPVGSPLFGANFNNMQGPVSPGMAPQVTPCGYYPQASGYYYGR